MNRRAAALPPKADGPESAAYVQTIPEKSSKTDNKTASRSSCERFKSRRL